MLQRTYGGVNLNVMGAPTIHNIVFERHSMDADQAHAGERAVFCPTLIYLGRTASI